MLKIRRYIYVWIWRIRNWFVPKPHLGGFYYVHFYISPHLYISQIETNCQFVRRLIGHQISPLIFYRILDLEKHPSLPKLVYSLLFKFQNRDIPIYLNLGKYLLGTCGRLKVEKEEYVLKVHINSILPTGQENHLDINPHYKQLGDRIYRLLVDKVSKQDLNIHDLLSMQPSSRSNLFRIFKMVVGVSPNTVRRDYRIFKFQKRLLETNHSVYTLYLESGFKSRAHLYSLFYKICRMSPKMFRRKYRDKSRYNQKRIKS